MLPLGQNREVLVSVIRAVAVDVMDHFAVPERPSQHLLSHLAIGGRRRAPCWPLRHSPEGIAALVEFGQMWGLVARAVAGDVAHLDVHLAEPLVPAAVGAEVLFPEPGGRFVEGGAAPVASDHLAGTGKR